MDLRSRMSLVVFATCVVGCGSSVPTEPTPVAPPPVVVVPPPVAVAPPAPAPAPEAPASSNRPPTISGQDVCISPLDADHVFELKLQDRDGDTISWRAEKREGTGRLHDNHGGPVASDTTIRIVYSPPAGRVDENWITVTATDSRGGTAIKRLYVKNS